MTFSVDRLPFYNNFSWIEGVKIIAAGGANCGILAVYKSTRGNGNQMKTIKFKI